MSAFAKADSGLHSQPLRGIVGCLIFRAFLLHNNASINSHPLQPNNRGLGMVNQLTTSTYEKTQRWEAFSTSSGLSMVTWHNCMHLAKHTASWNGQITNTLCGEGQTVPRCEGTHQVAAESSCTPQRFGLAGPKQMRNTGMTARLLASSTHSRQASPVSAREPVS